MQINSYRFGEMVIDGTPYNSDLILYPNRIDSGWWRKAGHQVCPEDISEILAAPPEYLVVGTGASGLMRILPETQTALQQQGIQLLAAPTGEAVNTYNELSASHRVIGAFHLTC